MLATPSRTPEGAPPPSPKITRGHSCILCQQRKVKCDKAKPCSNCIKARAECIPSAPTAPRRRRRKFSEQDLAAKLRRYENLLKKNGVKLDEDDDTHEDRLETSGGDELHRNLTLAAPKTPKTDKGILFSDHQNSRYVENTLWENLRDEIQDPADALQSSSDDDNETMNFYPDSGLFILGHHTAIKDLTALHPNPVNIFRLWQTFLVNVNPLVKIFHAPTIQQIILDATGNLAHLPKPTEALMFAIYLLAVTSLKPEECESMFGETRSSLLSKYSHGAQQALINAKFLKSLNLFALQAFALFLLALRRGYDPHTFWVLTGTAVRISQRLGIHRDGAAHQMLPFDAEIRRRTWWQVVFLDGQASKLAGAGFPAWLTKFDTQMPLNISDSDLSPGMKEAPIEKDGATEMMFCCLRYNVADQLRKSGAFGDTKTGFFLKSGPELIANKDKAIDDLETHFQDKFIKYCDPSIPLHLLAIFMSKSVICTMRLMAHHPRQYPDKGASMPQKEKDMLFSESLRELEIAQMGFENKLVQCFQWHIHVHFQLDAFIYVLSELKVRIRGEQVDRAWQQVEKAFEYRTEILNDIKNSLYFAMGTLTLKAWAKREEEGGLYQGSHQVAPPRFISVLRSQRNILTPPPQANTEYRSEPLIAETNPTMTFPGNEVPEYNGFDPATEQWKSMDFGYDMAMPDITPYDWEYWQTLMDGDLPTFTGDLASHAGNG